MSQHRGPFVSDAEGEAITLDQTSATYFIPKTYNEGSETKVVIIDCFSCGATEVNHGWLLQCFLF